MSCLHCSMYGLLKGTLGAGKMAQPVWVLATKPDDLTPYL